MAMETASNKDIKAYCIEWKRSYKLFSREGDTDGKIES